MFSNEKNVRLITRLIRSVREYGDLRLARFQIDFAHKMALTVSMLVVTFFIMLFLVASSVFFSFALLWFIEPLVGRGVASMIIAGLYIIGAFIVYWLRRPLLIAPLTLFFAKLFPSND